MKLRSFQDKVIVVTGAGNGLGAALARHFSRLGGKVILIDINKGAIDAVSMETAKDGSYHIPECKVIDVVDDRTFSATLEDVKKAYGSLDIIVNNAGILMAGEARDMNQAMFRKITDINLMGVVNGSLAAFKIMAAQGHGKIVNISSISGLIGGNRCKKRFFEYMVFGGIHDVTCIKDSGPQRTWTNHHDINP